MTVATVSARDRLKTIRDRTHNARAAKARAQKQRDAAQQAGDLDAAAICELAYEQADTELETASGWRHAAVEHGRRQRQRPWSRR